MNTFKDLYDFLEFAKTNRKYPENTANGLKSSLNIFEKELNQNELDSIDVVKENIEGIFMNVVSNNKDKSIGSLNTYRARVLKVIKDYQRYGTNPSKIQGWSTKKSSGIINPIIKKDILDKEKDNNEISLSNPINTYVHKIELSLRQGLKTILIVPKDINSKEANMIKGILDSLTLEK